MTPLSKASAGRAQNNQLFSLVTWLAFGRYFILELAFCPGHPKGGQPVPHPGFENQQFPEVVRRYLGGPGPPFPPDLVDSGGPGRNETKNDRFQKPATFRVCVSVAAGLPGFKPNFVLIYHVFFPGTQEASSLGVWTAPDPPNKVERS